MQIECEITKSWLASYSHSLQSNYSSMNCTLISLQESLLYAEKYHPNILVTTPCIHHESFGNYLSDYLESRICANLTGLHYISLLSSSSSSVSLLSSLPHSIYHPHASTNGIITAKKICTCYSICHENPYALLHSEVHMVRDILRPLVVTYYHQNMKKRNSIELSKLFWKSSLKSSYLSHPSSLPLIPDVAIHYRCGDNVVGHYGFLSFPIFSNRIPNTTTTIYILSESISRKQTEKRIQRCNLILTSLLEYLEHHFPSATIGILRGGNIYDDFTRLSLSSMVICSVSTFCYYAGLTSMNTVYLPITRLFAKATTPFYSSNIHWLDRYPSEEILLGQHGQYLDDQQLLQYLHHPMGSRPLPPPYIDLKKKPVVKYSSD